MTRWACWDCQKEFKPSETQRKVLDQDMPTIVCNKCYSIRLKKNETTTKTIQTKPSI